MASSARGPLMIGTIASALLVVAGVVMWMTAASVAKSFGWFAYAPLAEDVSPGLFFLSGQQLIGGGLIGLGLVGAGLVLGFRWGRGMRRRETAGPDEASAG